MNTLPKMIAIAALVLSVVGCNDRDNNNQERRIQQTNEPDTKLARFGFDQPSYIGHIDTGPSLGMKWSNVFIPNPTPTAPPNTLPQTKRLTPTPDATLAVTKVQRDDFDLGASSPSKPNNTGYIEETLRSTGNVVKTIVASVSSPIAESVPSIAASEVPRTETPKRMHGAPGPMMGAAGFPILAIGYVAYWLIQRRRRGAK